MDRGSYHCTGISGQNHPQEKEIEEASQIAEERREVKGKEEREKYVHSPRARQLGV